MNLKNLSAKNKAHKKILKHLKDKKILKIFNQFSKNIDFKLNLAKHISQSKYFPS